MVSHYCIGTYNFIEATTVVKKVAGYSHTSHKFYYVSTYHSEMTERSLNCIHQMRYRFHINSFVYYNMCAYDTSKITFAKVGRFVLFVIRIITVVRWSTRRLPVTACSYYETLSQSIPIAVKLTGSSYLIFYYFFSLIQFKLRLLGRLISLSRIRVELNNGIWTNKIKILSKSYKTWMPNEFWVIFNNGHNTINSLF